MDLGRLALNFHHFPLKTLLPSAFPSSSLPPHMGAKRQQMRLRCEFEVKVNGALSSDPDPRFLDRQKALEAAMNDINSSFGKGSVTRLGSAGGALVETFPSGCLTLDFALGGGLPKGRIVESRIYCTQDTPAKSARGLRAPCMDFP
ncbi:DNA repair protein recA-like 1, chloroplastic [Vitis vinifera]|uniref:DNA repair protein recA-like 1, chloroplastic n=1 Tax=Vitis vinifera TaxID=29760 RepID=A0A438DNL0_VITVI|nr:DNA repair protein recA-like 1, chloroplastic [Vitis vinifera]